MTAAAGDPGQVARDLSAYLCGTHLALRSTPSTAPVAIAAQHRLIPRVGGSEVSLGASRWQPDGDEAVLRDALLNALTIRGVVDLIVFGSQARGGRTGYSDVDAVLLVDDEVADSASRLRALRPHVLAAERAVQAYQPMQHHGFLVATPRLLRNASASLGMPAEALTETASLFGAGGKATFKSTTDQRPFDELAAALLSIPNWPRHPWKLHARLSMFELAPVLYLQAMGQAIEKHHSFAEARNNFGDSWWPYDVLDEVRRRWPRRRRPELHALSRALRNPWLAVAAWGRVPGVKSPDEVRVLLTPECLSALQSLVSNMRVRVNG